MRCSCALISCWPWAYGSLYGTMFLNPTWMRTGMYLESLLLVVPWWLSKCYRSWSSIVSSTTVFPESTLTGQVYHLHYACTAWSLWSMRLASISTCIFQGWIFGLSLKVTHLLLLLSQLKGKVNISNSWSSLLEDGHGDFSIQLGMEILAHHVPIWHSSADCMGDLFQ